MSRYCGMYGTTPPKTMAPAAPQETSWCSGTRSQPKPSASIPLARRPAGRLTSTRPARPPRSRAPGARCHPHVPPPPGTILRRGPGERKRSKDSAGPPRPEEPRPAHGPRPRTRAQGAPPARSRGTTPPRARTPGSAGEARGGPPAWGRQGDLPSGSGLGSRGGGRTAWGSEGQERGARPRWTRRRGRHSPPPQAGQTRRGTRVHVLRGPLPAHPCGRILAVCPLVSPSVRASSPASE